MAYRNETGSLNPMIRGEWDAGVIASTIANVNRGTDTEPFDVTDFTTHYQKPHKEEKPISLNEAMRTWG